MAMVEPLNPENGGNKSAEKSCQKPSLGARRRFSDITNLSRVKTEVKNENAKPILMFNTDMMEQVHKENAALLGLLAQRDETIKLCRLELQKVRSELLKTNWHLAQVNSQTLAELNITKEKMKLLQHEHGIVTGMLKAKNAELENKVKTLSQELHTLRKINKDEHTQCGELIKEVGELIKGKVEGADLNTQKKTLSRKSEICPCTSTQIAKKGVTQNKRASLKRPSSNFKFKIPDDSEDLFEIEDVNFPLPSQRHDPMEVDQSNDSSNHKGTAPDGTVAKEQPIEGNTDQKGEMRSRKSGLTTDQFPRRSSLGRPVRLVAEKVTSYKEMAINVKMRR